MYAPPNRPNGRISSTAMMLTGAAIVAAMIVGLTGPRLRDRHGTLLQETPIGELAYMAELQEIQQAFELRHAHARPAGQEERAATDTSGTGDDGRAGSMRSTDGPRLQSADPARVASITRDAFGRAMRAPDLSAEGYTPQDARIVLLAPGIKALAVMYTHDGGASLSSLSATRPGSGIMTVYAMPDRGHVVRLDGFGNAQPFAPGDEWASPGSSAREGPPRMLYATSDRDTFWLLVAPDAATVRRVAPWMVEQER